MAADKHTLSMQERMADLKEPLKKEKVKLTPEVEGYIQEHVRAVQDKLQNGEDVYEEDLAFIGQVKLWVQSPLNIREEFLSIGKMQMQKPEANKRNISLRQWLDVLHVAKAACKSREWIDKTFKFPGNGVIEVDGSLTMSNGWFARLPEGLRIRHTLNVENCTRLTRLPKDLLIGISLVLSQNMQIQIKEDAERLKQEGKIGGTIYYF